jgi:predicted HicB family RNase H-like nuclease
MEILNSYEINEMIDETSALNMRIPRKLHEEMKVQAIKMRTTLKNYIMQACLERLERDRLAQ